MYKLDRTEEAQADLAKLIELEDDPSAPGIHWYIGTAYAWIGEADKAFAAGVDRAQVATGVELIGLDRAEHIQNVIDGMRAEAAALGIRGEDLSR